MENLYVLEVQEQFQDKEFIHIGYMDKIFTSKIDAIEYYDIYNAHMRNINKYANLCSK